MGSDAAAAVAGLSKIDAVVTKDDNSNGPDDDAAERIETSTTRDDSATSGSDVGRRDDGRASAAPGEEGVETQGVWLSFAPVSTTASEYFDISMTAVNWLSTGFLFAFCVATPFTIYVLHKGGPKPAIITASVLLLVGNWIRYGGTRVQNYGVVMFGQILTGFAQPFVPSSPTHYSDLWFTNNGRVAATAIMTLANPLGGALGQLIDPFFAPNKGDIPNMVLYISIIATVASIPSFFIPAAPPTPSSPSSTEHKLDIIPSIKTLFKSPEFIMMLIPYTVYVGLFNSISSLLNQMLSPYGFTEEEAGLGGAFFTVAGLVAAAISSPILDRSKKFLLAIKIQSGRAAPYTILAILGAASFTLLPVALEYVTELTHPVSPEVTSTILWSGGQLLGGLFIVISDALTDGENGGPGSDVPRNMQRALWFQAVIAMVVMVPPLCLGLFGRREQVKMRRVEADKVYREGQRTNGGAVS
ncbi:hypothetical protein VE04_02862 [Pseudogymnoascus sp. 24MN13]|nr:hypothetical protein VE04_02862 [Pseudogymnoascus sp. 24MN13]